MPVNTSEAPDTTDREISFTMSDGEADSLAATGTVKIVPPNEVPTITSAGAAVFGPVELSEVELSSDARGFVINGRVIDDKASNTLKQNSRFKHTV